MEEEEKKKNKGREKKMFDGEGLGYMKSKSIGPSRPPRRTNIYLHSRISLRALSQGNEND